jgi:hypothetical protein
MPAGLAQQQCLHNRVTADRSRKLSVLRSVKSCRIAWTLPLPDRQALPPATARRRRCVVARVSRRWLLECEFAAIAVRGRRLWCAPQRW